MSPKVSILIPAYNVEKYIINTLKSIYNQTLCDFEVVIVDDGSTDNTFNMIWSFINSQKREDVYITITSVVSQ